MSTLKDKIYSIVPIIIQNLMVSVYGYFWKEKRMGGVFKIEHEGFKKREIFTSEQWKQYQNNEFKKLIIHAYQSVPYYNNTFSQVGYNSKNINSIELSDIVKLPFLTKEEFRKYGKTSILANPASKKGSFYTSSGSTGTPTNILLTKSMHQKWFAAYEQRVRNWAGISLKDSRGMIGGRKVVHSSQKQPPFHRYNIFEKQVYFSINHLSKDKAKFYVDAINKYNLKYMTGYAISNYLLASYINELNLNCKPLKAVITSSEKLTQNMRLAFKQAFGCKTFDSWSGIEACGLISECEFGKLHISPDVGIIEVLDEFGNNTTPGEIGEVVCTGLLNFDQPLIRYKIGDMIRLSENQSCLCGRHMPIVDEIVGRIDDIVTLSDGRQLGSFNRFFAEIVGIAEVQVVQKDFEVFQLNIVPTIDYSENTIKQINKIFFDKLGHVKLNFNVIDKMPRNENGKFKAVISEVKY